MPGWIREFIPILVLLALIGLVVARLPRVDLGHTPAFLRRRFINWFPVGLSYAFLYMARYNLNAFTKVGFTKEQFYEIDSWGALTYGVAFILNGPITDRIGGRWATVLATTGAAAANFAMAFYILPQIAGGKVENAATLVPTLSLLYALNMYFQSFGAVSIVKVNSAWFHLRERGTFGGIFGILISLGLYFAYDWTALIVKHLGPFSGFAVPAGILVVFAVLIIVFVRDTPGEAGHTDFELGDATSASGEKLPVHKIALAMLKNPAIVTIALVEFCSGFFRNGVMKTYRPFIESVHREGSDFIYQHWGMVNCTAGILGAIVAGAISDRIFSSRRGPVAAVLYGLMVVAMATVCVVITTPAAGWVFAIAILAVIGVHGMLSGTASMDFGGKKNVGIVVGLIDGLVYLGSTAVSRTLKYALPAKEHASDPAAWRIWPIVLLPSAIVGLLLALRLWNARPVTKAASTH